MVGVPDDSDEIRTVTVTWGEEVHQPIQYNGFRNGPITLTAPVRDGETVKEAIARLWKELDAIGKELHEVKLKGFLERLKSTGATVARERVRGADRA